MKSHSIRIAGWIFAVAAVCSVSTQTRAQVAEPEPVSSTVTARQSLRTYPVARSAAQRRVIHHVSGDNIAFGIVCIAVGHLGGALASHVIADELELRAGGQRRANLMRTYSLIPVVGPWLQVGLDVEPLWSVVWGISEAVGVIALIFGRVGNDTPATPNSDVSVVFDGMGFHGTF